MTSDDVTCFSIGITTITSRVSYIAQYSLCVLCPQLLQEVVLRRLEAGAGLGRGGRGLVTLLRASLALFSRSLALIVISGRCRCVACEVTPVCYNYQHVDMMRLQQSTVHYYYVYCY